ncbi:MAG: hypothetical protein HC773_00955 [Scytonema sp. CRU_2_7]|nr:hypothetical protein [Scytonema sp. CRU_2_7]
MKPVNKPVIKLFGIEQKRQNVYLVHTGEVGVWLVSKGERSVGEYKFLSSSYGKIEEQEMAKNWLILRILEENKAQLKAEYLEKNPDELKLEELELLDKKEGNDLIYRLEMFIRSLIQEDLTHPIIYKYAQELTASISSPVMMEHQLKIVEAAFKYRVVTNAEVLVPTDDEEHCYIDAKHVLDNVGMQPNSAMLEELSEGLAVEIYKFMQNDFKGLPHRTTQQLEAEAKALADSESNPEAEKTEAKPVEALLEDDEDDSGEKKLLSNEIVK